MPASRSEVPRVEKSKFITPIDLSGVVTNGFFVKNIQGTAIEVFLSGPGLENWFEYTSGIKKNSREVVKLFKNGDKVAIEVMEKYFQRTARAFSTFVNILDPDIIVCGGGMSEIDEIYSELPQLIIPYLASDIFLTPITKAEHGASSGVRGAAHLW